MRFGAKVCAAFDPKDDGKMIRDVLVFSPSEEHLCSLTCTQLPDRRYSISIACPEAEYSAVSVDAFDALEMIRLKLEAAGRMIAVQGSRREAYASGLQRDMHGGIRAYICKMGEQIAMDDLVDIFAAADRDQVATVAEQHEWYRRWRASI